MVKLVGACLILFAGTMLGFYQALQLSRRPRQIRQLVQALQRLETEISYGFSPLPSALLMISRQIPQPLSQLFLQVGEQLAGSADLTTQESWRLAIDSCWQHTAMKTTEKEAFLQLGLTLGITDREDQIKHLSLTESQLQTEELTAGEEQKRYEKMWKSLGLLSATLVVILMY
jgi:stage III sporulation protein AB